MARPQQPEVYRSGTTPALEPDSISSELEARRGVDRDVHEGDVPPENRPGHHPESDQDRPDLEAVAEALGTIPPEERDAPAPAPASTGPAPALLRRVPRLARDVGLVGLGLGVLAVREVTRRLPGR